MNRDNILRYLKIKSEPDSVVSEMISDCIAEAKESVSPKSISRVFKIDRCENGITLGGLFFKGKKIIDRLKDDDLCAVFAVTLGPECDFLLRKYSVSNQAKAVVMQAVLADYTEDICDEAERDIISSYPGYVMDKRFSPGYPGLPLSFQKNIFAMLEITKRIGITLTTSDMMLPSKSVTAFAGLRLVDKK